MLLHNRSGFHTPPGELSRTEWHPPSGRLYFDAQPFIRFRGIELSDEELYALEALEDGNQDGSDDSLILNLPNLSGRPNIENSNSH